VSAGVKLAVSLTAVSAAAPPRVSALLKVNAAGVEVCIGLLSVTVRPSGETLVTRVPGRTPVPLTNCPAVRLKDPASTITVPPLVTVPGVMDWAPELRAGVAVPPVLLKVTLLRVVLP
jgi:hypothetical protein